MGTENESKKKDAGRESTRKWRERLKQQGYKTVVAHLRPQYAQLLEGLKRMEGDTHSEVIEKAIDFYASSKRTPVLEKHLKSNPLEKKALYQNFWQSLLEQFKMKYPGITNASKGPAQSWCAIPSGCSGLAFQWAFKKNNRFIIELYIDFSGDKGQNRQNKNEAFFKELAANKEVIEGRLGELNWELLPNSLSCRVGLERDSVNINKIPEDLYDYAIEKMKLFRDTLIDQINRNETIRPNKQIILY